MKKIYIFFAMCLLLATAAGCSSEFDSPAASSNGEKRIEVGMNVTMPLPSLPGSRAVTYESAINDYVVWVFSEGAFVEAIQKGATYTDINNNVQPKVRLSDAGDLYILLKEEWTNVQMMMVANYNITAPAVGTSWADAETAIENATFTYDGQTDMAMPFYGTSTTTIATVAPGAVGGQIQLIRALARVDLYITDEIDPNDDIHFELTAMHVYKATSSGSVKQKTILPTSDESQMYGTVLQASDNPEFAYQAVLYMPEVGGIADGYGTSTYVIFEGDFKSYNSDTWEHRYYRLDFIKKTSTAGVLSYTVLDKIERNHRYIFHIDFLTPTAGKKTLQEALDNQSVNFYDPENYGNLSIINENEIMNITTDNYVYLGVTADKLTATKSDQNGDYWALLYVMTNNVNGWYFDDLTTGVSVSTERWTGSSPESTPVYVWIAGPRTSGSTVEIFLFASRIRKEITITIP